MSILDPRLVLNYFENMLPRNILFSQSRATETQQHDQHLESDTGLFRVQPVSRVIPYKTTITPFGPVLPTSFCLSSKEVPQSAARALSSAVLSVPSMPSIKGLTSPGTIPFPQSNCTASASFPEEMMKRILRPVSSSSESESGNASYPPLPSVSDHHDDSRRDSRASLEFVQQATAVHSPVIASSIHVIPNEAPALSPPSRIANFRTPKADRLRKRQEELEKVQQFIEEQRVVHDKIYASFDVRRVSSRGFPGNAPEKMSSNKKAPTEVVSESNNVAELRRNIALSSINSNKSDISPLPAKATYAQRATSADKRTPSASSRSPRPVSPDRIVSGVFVSYPRKARRSISAPPSEGGRGEIQAVASQETNLLSSLRPQGTGKTAKMTATEYAELRRNLLTRSEQHAVTSTGSSLT